jgi:hypothetical protein
MVNRVGKTCNNHDPEMIEPSHLAAVRERLARAPRGEFARGEEIAAASEAAE